MPDLLDFQQFLDVVRQAFPEVDLVGADEQTQIGDDLGLDSLDFFRLVVVAETLAGKPIDIDTIGGMETLGDVHHMYSTVIQH